MTNYYLGIDFGTSGARAIAIDPEGQIVATAARSLTSEVASSPSHWQDTLFTLLAALPPEIRSNLRAIAVNGTSATVLLCDSRGYPLDGAILYGDGRGIAVRETLQAIAPANHPAASVTSSLAKLLWWQQQPIFEGAAYFLHQADWLAFLLHGQLGISDYHNALKLGYDAAALRYPPWLEQLSAFPLLPQVLPPGTPIAAVTPRVARELGLPRDCFACAGTTDSIAAFLASGAREAGTAVTSLGSTLVLKLLSETPVESASYGIYSHRLGDLWLAGGASNAGGAVLKQFFSEGELAQLSQQIDGTQESPLHYYPLLQAGERFPVNDPQLAPQLAPRPEAPAAFLHGLLESLSRIEALGYRRLQELGATPLVQVYTAGGGAKNATWQVIRQRHLQVPVTPSLQTEAAFGTALLAQYCSDKPEKLMK